jgi:hypothetical protein
MLNPDRSALLEAYRNGPSDLRLAMDSFPEEMWAFRPAEGSWTIHEIVVHLGDTEVQSHVRFRTTIAEPSTTLPYYDEYRWSQALKYSSQSVPLSLQIISLMRECNHSLLVSLEDSLWLNSCHHAVRGPETLETLVRGYVTHMAQHIAQMKRCHDAWLSTPRI